jgi:putative DNA primase/helicase
VGLILPPALREVIICADYDGPGLKAARKAAEHWAREGRVVRIAKPPREGIDFNDLLLNEEEEP